MQGGLYELLKCGKVRLCLNVEIDDELIEVVDDINFAFFFLEKDCAAAKKWLAVGQVIWN